MISILKMKDLQAFGKSIIDIIMARHEEMENMQDTTPMSPNGGSPFQAKKSSVGKGQTKRSTQTMDNVPTSLSSTRGAIKYKKKVKITDQLDLIPLNWCKVGEIKYIFEMLRLCFGPYNHNMHQDS